MSSDWAGVSSCVICLLVCSAQIAARAERQRTPLLPHPQHYRRPLLGTTDDLEHNRSWPIRKACALTRGRWCKNFLQQPPRSFKSPIRGSKTCPRSCLLGTCNADTGICACPAGAGGEDCGSFDLRPCSNRYRTEGSEPASHIDEDGRDLDLYAGGYLPSRCNGICDPNHGTCYCDGSKYGRINAAKGSLPGAAPVRVGRPKHEHCNPEVDETGRRYGFGSTPWEHVYGPKGWCSADEPEFHCGCPFDGWKGRLCDEPVEPFCPNQCGGHGECNAGFCKCHEGWYGHDCAQKVQGSEMEPGHHLTSRPWLRELVVTPPAADPPPGAQRRRPFIYVYDLPPKYHAHLLAYRAAGSAMCVWRMMGSPNVSNFMEQVYATEPLIHELLLQSEHRTFDPEEADFFFVPAYFTCFPFPIYYWADKPWWGPPAGPRVSHVSGMMAEIKTWIDDNLPWWKRRGGRDHIWLALHDEGACWAPSEILATSIILTHWGRMDANHTSNTAYAMDNYDQEHMHPTMAPQGWQHLRQPLRPCYDPKKDLVIPQFKVPYHVQQSPLFGAAAQKRTTLLFFRGDVGKHRLPNYSRGIRQKLFRLSQEGNWRDKYNILIGAREDIDGDYSAHLVRSKFCLAAPGDGFSGRSEDAILHGCVPVVVADEVQYPFESVLRWEHFSVRVREADVDNMPAILTAIGPDELLHLQRNLRLVWHRFYYVSHPLLQRSIEDLYSKNAEAREAASQQQRDGPQLPLQPYNEFPQQHDAFATIIQWLHSRISTRTLPSGIA